jgi:hypothetical protein
MKDELIFIGKKQSKKEMEIRGKPDFHDALLLSKQSPQNTFYQFIPLRTDTTVSIHFSGTNTQFTYQQHVLKIETELDLTEGEAFDIFRNFAIKEGTKIAYLTHCPSKRQKGKKSRVLEKTVSRALNDI